jgi:large subunit ribosomal protein L18e
MKSKSKISKQSNKKRNNTLIKTILECKKNKNWLEVASILSGPKKRHVILNLEDIEKKITNEKKIVIPGKILSQGEINKKIELIALKFSKKAEEKLNNQKIKFYSILEEIKKNPDAKDIKILSKK